MHAKHPSPLVINTPNCINTLKFHPIKPNILVAGSVNG